MTDAPDIRNSSEEDTIYVDDDMIKFVGPRLYSEFVNGTEKMKYCDDAIVE